jgi:hypothetical protein
MNPKYFQPTRVGIFFGTWRLGQRFRRHSGFSPALSGRPVCFCRRPLAMVRTTRNSRVAKNQFRLGRVSDVSFALSYRHEPAARFNNQLRPAWKIQEKLNPASCQNSATLCWRDPRFARLKQRSAKRVKTSSRSKKCKSGTILRRQKAQQASKRTTL